MKLKERNNSVFGMAIKKGPDHNLRPVCVY